MSNTLSDQGELELLRRAYAGETLTVGLYNESGNIPEYTTVIEDGSEASTEDTIESVNISLFVEPTVETDIKDDKITVTEGSTLSDVSKTEPDRSLSYTRQDVDIKQSDIKQVFGFKDDLDLSASIEVPKVEFNVSSNTREINAVFVAKGDDLLFSAYLPQNFRLDSESSVKVTNVKLLLE